MNQQLMKEYKLNITKKNNNNEETKLTIQNKISNFNKTSPCGLIDVAGLITVEALCLQGPGVLWIFPSQSVHGGCLFLLPEHLRSCCEDV